MNRKFTDENFEDFLRGEAGNFRMRPSDDVWKGIRIGLARKRRRLFMALGSFAAAASLFGYFLIDFTVGENAIAGSRQSEVRSQESAASNSKTPTSASQQQAGDQGGAKVIPLHPERSLAYNESFYNETTSVESTFTPSAFSPLLMGDARPAVPGTSAVGRDVSLNAPLTAQAPPAVVATTDVPVSESTDEPTVDRGPSTVTYASPRRSRKTSFQLSFTPTISYRKLSEDNGFLQAGVPRTGGGLFNLNNFLEHKPDVGFELGLSARRPVATGIKARAGIQFNVNRYSIRAYNAVSEITNIPLSSNNRLVDSFATISSLRASATGSRPDWLQNYYFQVSAPVGLEVKLFNGKNGAEIGIASTVQPTYILGDRAYLISTDLKNYAEVPWLIRRVNVNTNFETFVAYNTGKVRWQVGPQVRYQLLSSFRSNYPVKENLFDYGLKVGLSINR